MTEEDKLIEDQLKSLPENLQKAIQAVPWKASVKEIGLGQKLSVPQLEILERETMLVIYNFDEPAHYIDNIVKEVGVDEETAITIAESVDGKIFKAIGQQAEARGTETPHNLPMVEKGEVAHSVPHVELAPVSPKPGFNHHYPDGNDPYREPLV